MPPACKWTRNATLVRGLDYYRHTAFEFVTDRLGAQGTVLGGGRYDGLIETLGGPHTPARRLGRGDRAAGDAGEAPRCVARGPQVALIPMGAAAEAAAQGIVATLRRAGISADMAYRGNIEEADAEGECERARVSP